MNKMEEKKKKSKKSDSKHLESKSNKKKKIDPGVPIVNVLSPIWLSVSESARIGGVNTKTIRRAISDKKIKYKIHGNRYLIDIASVIIYLNTNTKLKNKLLQYGIGQYVEKWKK